MKPVASSVAATRGLRLPELRIVPADALLLHEEGDPLRIERLARALEADGVLRNPPIAAALGDGRYVVLDGANRVTALQRLAVPDTLVQVVDYDDPAVRLEVWAHYIAGAPPDLPAPAGWTWRRLEPEAAQAAVDRGALACAVVTRGGAQGLAPVAHHEAASAPASHAASPGVPPAGDPGGDLPARVAALREVVRAYKGQRTIYRVAPAPFAALADEYGEGALVVFPSLTKDDIRALARGAVRLPTGISRHLVPGRALRVNLDLALLRATEETAVKQARLDEAVRARLLEHRVRHYPEPTILFDE